MRGMQRTPIAALRRKKKGPRGQATRTITTDPKEVDEIVREAYGKIYAGNVKKKNVDKMVEAYMKNYIQISSKAKRHCWRT